MVRTPVGRALVIGACFVVVVAGLRAASSFLGPTLLALLIAVAVLPIIHWFERKGLPTWLSVLLVVLGGVVIGTGLIIFVTASFASFGDNLPTYQSHLAKQFVALTRLSARLGIPIPHAVPSGLFSASRIFGVLGSFVGLFANSLAFGFLTLLLFVIFSIETPRISARISKQIGDDGATVDRFGALGSNISSYFRVRAINNLFLGVSLTIFLWLLGVDFPGLWGVLAFFLGFIPNIGVPLAVAPAVLLGWIEHGWVIAVIVIIGAVVINFLGDDVLTPHLAGKALNMSTATIFVSFIFWSWVFGALGALISIPLTSIVMAVLDNYDETRWVANLMSASEITPSPKQGVTENVDQSSDNGCGEQKAS